MDEDSLLKVAIINEMIKLQEKLRGLDTKELEDLKEILEDTNKALS